MQPSANSTGYSPALIELRCASPDIDKMEQWKVIDEINPIQMEHTGWSFYDLTSAPNENAI